MAMQNPPTLLGPGGVPLQTQSNFRCPSCGHRPPVANNPQFPPGTPMAMMTSMPGEEIPQLNCLMCWNKFWAKFIRRHAPQLQMVADGVQYVDADDVPDAEEEIE